MYRNIFSYEPSPVVNEPTEELKEVKVTSELGKQLNLNIDLINEKGEKVILKDYFSKGKPILLSLVYFNCPTLCNFHLDGVLDVLRKLKWSLGDKFEYVTISIDHNESYKDAQIKKKIYMEAYNREESDKYWHFLTGTKENIKNLASELGFGYRWNPKMKQWIHPSVLYIITPESKISVFLHGVKFDTQSLRFGLMDASDGKIGNIVDKFAMFCFQYDPNARRYSLYSYNLMRLGGVITIFILSIFLTTYWLVKRKNKGDI